MPDLSVLEVNGVPYDLRDPTKAPAGYVVTQYNPTSEANLEEILDTVVNGMANKTGRYYLLNDNQGVLWGGGTAIAFVFKRNATTAITRIATNNYGGVELVKVVDGGVWQKLEWENPPMEMGVEYRTTERWQGKAVYAKLIDCGTPANGVKTVEHGASATQMIRCNAAMNNGDYRTTIPYNDGTYTISVQADITDIVIVANISIFNVCAQIWYTKD